MQGFGVAGSAELKIAQQEVFARHCVTMNHSEAYRLAFPSSQKWKPETLHSRASRMAAECQSRIDWLRRQAAERSDVTEQRVVEAFAEIAFSATEETKDRLFALDKLAKWLGMYIGKKEALKQVIFNVSGGEPFDAIEVKRLVAREAVESGHAGDGQES